MPADVISYGELPAWSDDVGPTFFLLRPGDEHPSPAEMEAIHPIHLKEDPIHLDWQEGGSSALKRSDFFAQRELHRSRLYNLAMKPFGITDSLGVMLPMPDFTGSRLFSFDRGASDFSGRDRAVLDLLSPHLAKLVQASENRRRLQAALALHESSEAAIVLLEADGRIDFANRAARELLDRYFRADGVRLPDALASWLRERRTGATTEPLRIEVGQRVLIVELVEEGLLLTERQLRPRLTQRELEILELVAEGMTNGEIAQRLWVSPLTVRRHLENVYAKLGVHTRTAAAAFVRGRPLDGPAALPE